MSEPKRYMVYDFERRETKSVIDYRGTQDDRPPRPATVKCDFCSRESDRLWCREVSPFVANMSQGREIIYDGGNWNACVFCNPMVEARDMAPLIARVKIIDPDCAKVPTAALEALYGAVFEHTLLGPVIEWHAGDMFPVRR